MPYLIAPVSNPNDTQLVDDIDLGLAQANGYSVIRYVADGEAEQMAAQGIASTVGPASFNPAAFDPTAPQTRNLVSDAVAMSNAATGQTNAETNYLSTVGSQFLEARGPKNVFQYANAMVGQPKATIPAWAAAMRGVGSLVYSPISDSDRTPLAFGDIATSGKAAAAPAAGGQAAAQPAAQPAAQAAAAPAAAAQQGMQWGPRSPSDGTGAVRVEEITDPGLQGGIRLWYGDGSNRSYAPNDPVVADYHARVTADPSFGGWRDPAKQAASTAGVSGVQAQKTSSNAQGTFDSVTGLTVGRQPGVQAGSLSAYQGQQSNKHQGQSEFEHRRDRLVKSLGLGSHDELQQKYGIRGNDLNHILKIGDEGRRNQELQKRGIIGAAGGFGGRIASNAVSQAAGGGDPPFSTESRGVPPIPRGASSVGAKQMFPPARDDWSTNNSPAYSTGPGLAGGEAAHPWPTQGVPGGYVPPSTPVPPADASIPSPPAAAPPVTHAARAAHAARTAAATTAPDRSAALAAQQAEYARLMKLATAWYAAQFGTPLDQAAQEIQATDADTVAYRRAALGMARAGQIQQLLGLDDQGNPLQQQPAAPAAPAPAVAANPAPYERHGAGDMRDWVPGITDTTWAQQALRTPGAPASNPIHRAMGGTDVVPGLAAMGGMQPPAGGMDPSAMGGGMPMDMGGAQPAATPQIDPTNPQQPPEALAQIAQILASPPSPQDDPLTQAVRANWTLDPASGQPKYTGTAAQGAMAMAGGGTMVVRHPTNFAVNGQAFVTGEASHLHPDGADELVMRTPLADGSVAVHVVPLQNPHRAVPAWAAHVSNGLVAGAPYHATHLAGGGLVVVPAWARVPMAEGGAALVYGQGTPAVLAPGAKITNAAVPLAGNRGISDRGTVRVPGPKGGMKQVVTPNAYTPATRWNPVVSAQINANPTLKAMFESGLSAMGLDANSEWASFYSSLPRQNPGTAVRMGTF